MTMTMIFSSEQNLFNKKQQQTDQKFAHACFDISIVGKIA